MGKPTGFMEFPRQAAPYRPAKERLLDFNEIYTDHDIQRLSTQSARCMDCGVPFCQSEEGCPIHNLIPEFNDLVFRDEWREALDRLQKTNNFPNTLHGLRCAFLPIRRRLPYSQPDPRI